MNSPKFRAAIAWGAVGIHLVACIGLLGVSAGTELNTDDLAREQYVGGHRGLWIAVWASWMLASVSLLAFCIVWSLTMRPLLSSAVMLRLGCEIVAIGVACDLLGETCLIAAAYFHHTDTAGLILVAARMYQFLSPAAANGLYCIGGLVLSMAGWRSGWLRGWLAIIGYAMWVIGLGLTVGAIWNHPELMAVSGAGVMVLFIVFASCVGWRIWRGQSRTTS